MKLQSYTITQGRDRAPARAMLKGIGFTDEDLAKPIIGVANTWIETMPDILPRYSENNALTSILMCREQCSHPAGAPQPSSPHLPG
jgi:dihydroxyacid dehydratase/phosphogluconate dehydratase